MQGNKINIGMLRKQEITIAQCCLLRLVWNVSPGNLGIYEVKCGEENLFVTSNLAEAIVKYNELVI